MALADPLSLKIGASTSSLPRVSTGDFKSIYQSESGLVRFRAETTGNTKRKRQVARVDLSKITANPFESTKNEEVGMSAYLVFDRPLVGFSNTEALEVYTGLQEMLEASTNKILKQILASES